MGRAEVREKVLGQVLPEDSEAEESREMFSRIQEFIQEEFGLDAELMGSTAKGTFMAGDKDLDIFVFFDEGVPEEELEEKGLDIGEAVFDKFGGEFEVEFAEHPYTKGVIEDYEVEVVPAYRVDSGDDIKSSVDRTPFHTRWVNENLSEEEKQEVVLLKAFLRGRGLYGSTLSIEGFSGYLCELLVHEYGSLENLLESAVDWEQEEVVDPGEHHEKLPARLREKFEDENLVVVDPVDPQRNVASVLSRENYASFVHAAWTYLENPSEVFFFPEEEVPGKKELKKSAADRGDFVVLEFDTPELLDDILYPQLRRVMSRLEDVVVGNEFRVFHSGFHVGGERTRLLFELFSAELPEMRKHKGPEVFHNTEHLDNFTSKYGEVWVEDTRLVTIVEREFTCIEDLMDDFLAGDLRDKGVPENLVDAFEAAEIQDIQFDGDTWRRFLRDRFHLGVKR